MANYWAITIGINQYRHLQPLRHAQNDALFIHQFLTETADIASDHCVLLSDLSTSVGHQAVYPDKPALSEWIQTITQRVGPDDVLWFFFSGYGVQLDGADYLMPIDGDPEAISETGLAIESLVETLKQLPTQNILLALDINRSQGSFSGQAIGAQVIQLVRAAQVPTLLSCEPEQYSHETLGVRHGLFTAAFLEALQQRCTTFSQISDYVSKRLPELCEHHWRPIQNLVSLIPDQQQSAVVVPDVNFVTDVNSVAVSKWANEPSTNALAAAADGGLAKKSATSGSATATAVRPSQVLAGTGGTLIASGQPNSNQPEESTEEGAENRRDRSNDNSSAIVHVDKPEMAGSPINGTRLRNWGLLALAVLMGAVLLKPVVQSALSEFNERTAAVEDTPEDSPIVEEPVVDADTVPPSAVLQTAEETELNPTETPAAAPTTEPAETQPDSPTDTAEAAPAEASSEASPETPPETAAPTSAAAANEQDAADAQTLIAQANSALAQRQYSEAITTLRQVPRSQRDSQFSETLAKARAGAADARQFNASVLTEARTYIQSTQASQFTEMIAQARLIQPGEPYYEEAQQDIRSWSQTILDIAKGRATSGNLEGAIAAASIMPADNPELKQKANDAITNWQQRQRSREIIAEAQRIPKSGQASTYQKGIVKLREVPIEHAEYETAQRLADDWSERIFSIAQARAAQGRRRAAIQAAILVPAGTTAYEPTQQAIRRWQNEE